MTSRIVVPALLALSCVSCVSAPLAPQPVAVRADGTHFLRGADCLDPGMARSWADLGDGSLLVDAGRRKYHIRLGAGCQDVHWTPMLLMRGEPISGRVCGGLGDAVISRDYTCRIQDMQMIDGAQYKALIQRRDDERARRRANPAG